MTIFINTVTLLIDTVIITKITATIFQTLVLAGIADSRLHFNPGVCCSVYGIQGGTNVAVNRSHQTSANADQPKLEIHSLQRTAEKCAPTRLVKALRGRSTIAEIRNLLSSELCFERRPLQPMFFPSLTL